MRKISGAVQLLNCAGDFLEIVGAEYPPVTPDFRKHQDGWHAPL